MTLADSQLQDAPAAVQEADAPFDRLIADGFLVRVWVPAAAGGVAFLNRRCYEYTGLDHVQLQGWGWKCVIHPDDWERCLAAWTRALQTGERFDAEFRLRRRDGVFRWHRASAVATLDAAGRPLRWFGTSADIEDDVRGAHILESMVEERTRALSEVRRRLQAIIENEPECVKLLD